MLSWLQFAKVIDIPQVLSMKPIFDLILYYLLDNWNVSKDIFKKR